MSQKRPMGPTFIGIGAQKSATTWLYDVLSNHPQIHTSEDKELDFFSRYHDYGYQWYENHFAEADDNIRAVGEVSPSYLCSRSAPEAAAKYNPDLKLVVLLRDPIQRAISNHKHDVRLGLLSGDISFEQGLINNPAYIQQGRYASHLRRWLEHFPQQNVHVIVYEDIKIDAARVVRDLYDFVGVDVSHECEVLQQVSNPSYLHKSRLVETLRRGARKAVDATGAQGVWRLASKIGLQQLYRKLNWVPAADIIPPVSAASIANLRREFKTEIARLEDLLQRPLDAWKS